MFCIVADDGHVVGDGTHGFSVMCKMHQYRIFLTPYRPCIAVTSPVVGSLTLETVFDLLTEQTVAVADPIAIEGQVKCSCAVKETSSKPSESAIAECGIADLFKRRQRCAHLLQCLIDFVIDTQTEQIVENAASH